MTKFERLAGSAQIAYVIIGDPAKYDFEISDLKSWPLPEETQRDYHARGLNFVGLVGVVDGKVQTCLDTPLNEFAVAIVAAETLARLESEINQRLAVPEVTDRVQSAMFASYMNRLVSLPDVRTDA